MVDRVAEEIEEFAGLLREWSNNVIVDDRDATLQLIAKLKTRADTKSTDLKTTDTDTYQAYLDELLDKRLESTQYDKSASVRHVDRLTQKDQLSKRQPLDQRLGKLQLSLDESATWDLVGIIAPNYFQSKPRSINAPPASRPQPEDGKPQEKLWSRFLDETIYAEENYLILRWLEKVADRSGHDIQSMAERIETRYGGKEGTWSHGWLHTREKLKAEKRMRSWDTNMESPHIPLPNKSRSMVTQLDPDSTLRQHRSLDPADEQYERLQWISCFEMLRRGKSSRELREWCQDRNDHWRAVSLGASKDSEDGRLTTPKDGLYPLWRGACQQMCKGGLDPFEKACYGLLSGELFDVESVCQTWDDFLYARYNALLLSSFSTYLGNQQYPSRLPLTKLQKFGLFDAASYFGSLDTANSRIMETLHKDGRTSKEAKSPIKMIQSSLINRSFYDLLYNIGVAVSQKSNTGHPKLNLMELSIHPVDEHYMHFVEDQDAMRIVVHIFLILRRLKPAAIGEVMDPICENALVAYISSLRTANKIELLPLYAAQLTNARAQRTLGRILTAITNETQQREIVRLCQEYGLDIASILAVQFELCLKLGNFDANEIISVERYQIVEPTNELLWPGSRVRRDFMKQGVSQDETRIIESLRWYLSAGREWVSAFTALTDAAKVFLLHGRISAALLLVQELSVQKVSMKLTPAYFDSPPFDVTEEPSFIAKSEDLEDRRRSMRYPYRVAMPVNARVSGEADDLQMLRLQCQSYFELQQLILCISLLSDWASLEEQLVKDQKQVSKQLQEDLNIREAFEQIRESVEPLFSPIFQHPVDDVETKQFRMIYNAYIPELLIAYNSIIQVTANLISPDVLLQSFNLASEIASEDRSQLSHALKDTGRMAELVRSLAHSSRTLLKINDKDKEQRREKEQEKGRRRVRGSINVKRNRDWKGETMEIWNIGSRV